ncbi:SET and MYND domain-containing protein DDB_G0277331 [Hondaea fermentalgiana]|uniref:SET and MYND domain-containing protein DDB_G0277331 n=1 Tax=Hondaea fermentalgiana TaxID=2315210 RepID=A0A2R5G8A5_9STRA|nr:SET and MYND domain-containing protein DDB_G0277331 [Hondaea fermentalgiana]|eukprot:GBG26549.1 SET and MYND domain-containing protein DDB_G0277331 [Hondaea fermentalgiana]
MATAQGAELVRQLEKAPWGAEPQWHFEDNLKYDVGGADAAATSGLRCANHTCSRAGAEAATTEGDEEETATKKKQMRCAACQTCYCSRECQVKSWKTGHKRECPVVAAFKAGTPTAEQTHTVVEDMLRRIRMYMCPFAAGFSLLHGKGFVLLRSNSTLQQWVYEFPMDAEGQPLRRSVQLQYLTLGEFDGLAFEDDFELAAVRPKLEEALEAYEVQTQVVVVIVLKCGFFACVTIPMVPEFAIGKQLAAMYKYVEMEGPLQLNVDDSD